MRSVELGVAPSWTLRVYRPVLRTPDTPISDIRANLLRAIKEQGLKPTLTQNTGINFAEPPLVIFNRDNFEHAEHPSVEALADRNEEVAQSLISVLSGEVDDHPISRTPDSLFVRSLGTVTLFGIGYQAEQTLNDTQAISSHVIEQLAGESLEMRHFPPYVALGAVKGNDSATRAGLVQGWAILAHDGNLSDIPAIEFGPVTIDYSH